MIIEKKEKKLYASHSQFYIEDADNPGDTGASEFWTHAYSIPYNLHFDRWPTGYRGHPFMVRVDNELAGFALIKQMDRNKKVEFDMGEFFIVHKFRRKGVGTSVAHDLFARFPGTWHVRQMMEHKPAQAFWRRVIMDFTGGHFQEYTQLVKEYGLK